VNQKNTLSQAQRVIAKFGSASAVGRAIGRTPSAVCRWCYSPDDGGTDGIIPGPALRAVLKAAKELGIEITQDDLYPTRASAAAK